MHETPYSLSDTIVTALQELAVADPAATIRNVRAAMVAAIGGELEEGAASRLSAALAVELDAHVAVNALWERIMDVAPSLSIRARVDKILASEKVRAAVDTVANEKHASCVRRAATNDPAHMCGELVEDQPYLFDARMIASRAPEELAEASRSALRDLLMVEQSGQSPPPLQVTKTAIQHAVHSACQNFSGR